MRQKQAPKVKAKAKKLKVRRETIRDLVVKPTAAAKVKAGLLGRVEGHTPRC